MMKWTVIYALLTALFWGLYGPTLTQARSHFSTPSPFKPFVAIGFAYLVWGVLGGLVGMWYKNEAFTWSAFTGEGALWSFAAGSLGAFGALALTLAVISSGGKPYLVMPIVFGGAVTVSAIVSAIKEPAHLSPALWIGMTGIVVSVAVVAYFTPHSAPKKPAGTTLAAPEAPPPNTPVKPAPAQPH